MFRVMVEHFRKYVNEGVQPVQSKIKRISDRLQVTIG